MVEWDGLENRCSPCDYRGFESHSLRLIVIANAEVPPSFGGKVKQSLFWVDSNTIEVQTSHSLRSFNLPMNL